MAQLASCAKTDEIGAEQLSVPARPDDLVTYEEAAAILGCHFSNVAKRIRKGDLTSSGKRGASVSREQVKALAERPVAAPP